MLRPLADRVLVEPQERKEQTESGIVLPDQAKEKPMQGKVIAVGQGRLENGSRIAPEVKEGDLVLYGKYAGTEIKRENKTYLIMRESDILAVLSPSEVKELVANG